MRKDIDVPEVKKVSLAVAKDGADDWAIYLINNYSRQLHDTMVVSKGYGEHSGEKVKTSTLRHNLGTVEANAFSAIERIDPALFHLAHEFWVTFYIESQMFDKKFIFKAGTLSEENLLYIKELDKEGILNI